MAQKTAMQSLLRVLQMTREHSYTDMVHIPSLIDTIETTYLNMEKEQRQKDWDEGFEAATKSPDDVPLKINKTVTLNK